MVKEIVEYQCELCRKKYPFKEDAEDCEKSGIPAFPPIGTIFSNHEKITFAVCRVNKSYVHCFDMSLWACRDNGYGDSLYGSTCGSSNLIRGFNERYIPNPNEQSFLRMVKYLQDYDGIMKSVHGKWNGVIRVWDGKEFVELQSFLKESTLTLEAQNFYKQLDLL